MREKLKGSRREADTFKVQSCVAILRKFEKRYQIISVDFERTNIKICLELLKSYFLMFLNLFRSFCIMFVKMREYYVFFICDV